MQIPEKLKCNRAFGKKALNFIKYYTKTREDPLRMILETLKEIEKIVDGSEDIGKLEPLSKEAYLTGGYLRSEGLFQMEIIGEKDRFIIYRPIKFLESEEDGKIAYIYDLLYVPQEE